MIFSARIINIHSRKLPAFNSPKNFVNSLINHLNARHKTEPRECQACLRRAYKVREYEHLISQSSTGEHIMTVLDRKGESVGLRGAREMGSRKINSISKVTIVSREGQRLVIDASSGKIRESDSPSRGAEAKRHEKGKAL